MRRAAVGLAVGLLACALAPAPASAEPPRAVGLLKGPYLTGLSDSGVEVRFELDRASPAAVDVSADADDAGPPRRIEDTAVADMHAVACAHLEPATRYRYAVRAGGRSLAAGRFTTAPSSDSSAPLRFLVYGDTRTDATAHAAVVRALSATPADFLVNTGDVVEDGGRAEDWQSFFDVESTLLREHPIFVAIGNHELYDDRAGANFARYFGYADATGATGPRRAYGSVRAGNVRLFFLNAMHDWDSGDERAWLERELSRADAEPGLAWRIVVMHQGLWSSGPHGGSAALIRARVPDLLAAHGVDLVVSGHDHIYERGESGGLKYLVSGGGGAPLYRIAQRSPAARKDESTYHFVEIATSADAVALLARRIDGTVLDRCGFSKGKAGWDCDARDREAQPDKTPLAAPAPAAPVRSNCDCAAPGAPAAGGAAPVDVTTAGGRARAACLFGACAAMAGLCLARRARRSSRARPRRRAG